MPTGLASNLLLDVAASYAGDQLRDARERAQAADARRSRTHHRMASRHH